MNLYLVKFFWGNEEWYARCPTMQEALNAATLQRKGTFTVEPFIINGKRVSRQISQSPSQGE